MSVSAFRSWRTSRNRNTSELRKAAALCVGESTPHAELFEQMCNHEYLLVVWRCMTARNGPAPGIDGYTWRDFGKTDIAAILRDVATEIRDHGYQPSRPRLALIPKSASRTRELRLRTVVDRVVSASLRGLLEKVFEVVLLPTSYAYRPQRAVHDLLIDLEGSIITYRCCYIVQDDIRDAFGSVVIDDLLADFVRHIDDPQLLHLTGVVLRGAEGLDRKVGIDQGDPLSPLALNLRLHHALDLPLRPAGPGVPVWLRYADDLVCACPTEREGWHHLAQARDQLQEAGFHLKGEHGPPVNLRRQGTRVNVLGFELSLVAPDQIRFGLTRRAWMHLETRLQGAWEHSHPSEVALHSIRGWIQAAGPALDAGAHGPTVDRIRRITARMGLRERITESALHGWMQLSHQSWLERRSRRLAQQ